MKNRFIRTLTAVLSATIIMAGSCQGVVWAEEATEAVENAGEEGAEGAEASAEAFEAEEIAESGAISGVEMSTIITNNDRYMAAKFPQELLPEGFTMRNVTYEGQSVAVASFDRASSGAVVLAYLAESDGSNGDLYLCDINTAHMSDFLRIENGMGGYIIVLDPGDMIVAPGGFALESFQYNGKTLNGWRLPGEASAAAEINVINPFAPKQVYAAALAGEAAAANSSEEAATGDASSEGVSEENVTEASEIEEAAPGVDESFSDNQEADSQAVVPQGEDGSGVVSASESDFKLVYAINEKGVIGFYLLDTVDNTYQRYVSIASVDTMTQQYQKTAKVRLYIIIGLIVLLLISIFAIINILVARGDEYEDDDEEDEEEDEFDQIRRKVEQNSASNLERRRSESTERRGVRRPVNEDEEEIHPTTEKRRMATDSEMQRRRVAPVAAGKGREEQASRPSAPEGAPRRRPVVKPDMTEDVIRRPAARRPEGNRMPAEGGQPVRRRREMPQAGGTRPEDGAVRSRQANPNPNPQRRPVNRRPRRANLDEDFDYEFLDNNK